MSFCEGLPDGPCPKKVNNRSVWLSQGDLRLCPLCNAVRLPPKQQSESIGCTATATATLPAAIKIVTDNVKANNECIDGQCLDDKHVNTST